MAFADRWFVASRRALNEGVTIMSRKLLLSNIAIAATATLLGVGTYAKFSDSEVSTTHSVTAGTLDLKILNGEAPDSSYTEYAPFLVTNAAPGETSKTLENSGPGWVNLGTTKMVHFRNVGSITGNLSVKVVMDTNADNGINGPEAAAGDTTDGPGNGELAANMLVSIDGIGAMINLPLTTLDAAAPVLWGSLAPDAEGWVSVDWAIPASVGNLIQSDSASFHLQFTFEQA
ncbi:MAG: TasA family protein [Ilumatobacteraceae bacterium]